MEKIDPNLLLIGENGKVEHIKESLLDSEEVNFTGDVAMVYNNNNSQLSDAFRDRLVYKAFGTPTWLPRGFDFLDKNLFFGKVDTNGRAILPKQSNLVKVPAKFAEGDNVYINKHLYNLYIKFYEKLKLEFAVNEEGISMFLGVFQIAKGAGTRISTEKSYLQYASDIIKDIYTEEVLPDTTNVKDTAKDFQSYLNVILKLFKLGKIQKNVFFNEYILSSQNELTNSGLIFEIADRTETPYDDNAGKFTNFYRYTMYNRVASYLALGGIRYDANAPWRFGMDFNLKPTQTEINGISKQKFFEDNFDVIEGTLKEKELFYNVIFQSYLNLIETNPLYYRSTQKRSKCNKSLREGIISSVQSFERKIYSKSEFNDLYNKNFNIFLLRYAEMLNYAYGNRSNLNQILLDIAYKEKKGLDKEDLVRYTFNKMKYC